MISPLCETLGVQPNTHNRVQEAYIEARRHHGDLGINFDEFARHLTAIAQRRARSSHVDGFDPEFSRLHMRDVYVTAACALKEEKAWNYFVELFHSAVDELVQRTCRSRDEATEIVDRVLCDLYLPDRSGYSRVSCYDGRIPLAHWLRVIAINRCHSEKKLCDNNHEPLSNLANCSTGDPIDEIHTRVTMIQYGSMINAAIETAVESLSPRERRLIMWRYFEGRRGSDMAKMLGVTPSAITREITRIQKKVKGRTFSLLRTRHRLSSRSIAECASEISSLECSVWFYFQKDN